jgi:uncharacterized delta-60 repeat protein
MAIGIGACSAVLGLPDPSLDDGSGSIASDGDSGGGSTESGPDAVAELTLTGPAAARIIPGTTVAVPISVTRTGFEGVIEVRAASGLPLGVHVAPVTLDAGTREASLSIVADAGVAQTLANVVLEAVHVGGAEKASSPLTLTVRGRRGEIDTTFVSVPSPGRIRHITRAPDGKIYAVWWSGAAATAVSHVIRFLPNGELDNGFATAGVADTPSPWGLRATRILAQPDGRIVVAGVVDSSPVNAAFGRLLPTGQVDTGFGSNGISKNTADTGTTPVGLALAANGDIVYAANGGTAPSSIGRLNVTDGSAASMKVDSGPVRDVAIGPNGFIYAAGTSKTATTTFVVYIVANANGANYGTWTLDAPTASDDARYIFIDGAGRTIVGGRTGALNPSSVITRVNAQAGDPDATFGKSGWATGLPAGETSAVGVLVREPDDAGFLFVDGRVDPPEIVIARVDVDGKVDATFGEAGVATVSRSSFWTVVAAVLDSDPERVFVVYLEADQMTTRFMRFWR